MTAHHLPHPADHMILLGSDGQSCSAVLRKSITPHQLAVALVS